VKLIRCKCSCCLLSSCFFDVYVARPEQTAAAIQLTDVKSPHANIYVYMRWFVDSVGAGITGYHTQHHVLLVCGNIVKHAYSAFSFLGVEFFSLYYVLYIALVTKIIALLPVTHSETDICFI
jgi:hypothetical protein